MFGYHLAKDCVSVKKPAGRARRDTDTELMIRAGLLPTILANTFAVLKIKAHLRELNRGCYHKGGEGRHVHLEEEPPPHPAHQGPPS